MTRAAAVAIVVAIAAVLIWAWPTSTELHSAVGVAPGLSYAPAVSASTSPMSGPDVVPSPSVSATRSPAARTIAGARIGIPRLGIDLALAWGDVSRDVPRADYAGATPEGVALVFPGSALPGAGGNTYIYSHARTGMFLPLWQVRAGDLVLLTWPDASLRYAITHVAPRVDPTDVSWLDPSGPERLTLQTSTGPRASDPRFVAVATPLPSE